MFALSHNREYYLDTQCITSYILLNIVIVREWIVVFIGA